MSATLASRALAGAILLLVLAACGSLPPSDLAAAPEPTTEPTSAFTVDPPDPEPGDTVTFAATPIACETAPCTFAWDDVNGGVWPLGEGEVMTFVFRGVGVKRVRLTVTDREGEVTTHAADVRVGAAAGPAPAGDALSWAPPAGYEHYRVVHVPTSAGIGKLDDGTDYLLVMPDRPRRTPLTIDGGRNVVLIGGEIDIDVTPKSGARESEHRGVYVTGGSVQGRVVHIEGLLVHSSNGTISDGFHVSRGSSGNHFVLQIQNVRVGPLPSAYFGGTNTHPDLIQTWGSVGELRIDRFTGISAYQGLFFKADFNGRHGDVDVRRTNVRGLSGGAYLIWLSDQGGGWPAVSLDDVWVEPAPGREFGKSLWPDTGDSNDGVRISGGEATWQSLPVSGFVRSGVPAGGDFVPAGSVGIGYTSPGYR